MIKDKRKARRQSMRHTAWLAVSAEQRTDCTLSDVSDTGARVDVQDSTTIPDHFVLMLSSNGAARRFCRVVWRKPRQVGVKFARSLADAANAAPTAANATLVPQADADAAVAKNSAPPQAGPDKDN
jgi:hypothetical protein